MRPAFRRLLVVVAVFAAADLAVTVKLHLDGGQFRGRPLPPFGATPSPSQAAWAERYSRPDAGSPPGFDAELGWTNPPDSTKGRASFNSLGARGTREYDAQPPAGTVRLACFGDSYTFGDEVGDEECWPRVLEHLSPEVEALNFGVAGYGTDQSLLRFRRQGRHAAEIVTIGLLVENIGRNVNRYRPLYYPKTGTPAVKPRFVVDDDRLELIPSPYATAKKVADDILMGRILDKLAPHEYWRDAESPLLGAHPSSFLRLLATYRAYTRRQPSHLWPRTDAEPFRTTVAILRTFHEEAQTRGAARTLVLIFPRQKELLALQSNTPYWSTLHTALDQLEIPYLDVTYRLLEELQTGASLEDLYTGGHLSPRSNRIVAELVREELGL